ncbi:hypothetical protein V3N99_09175 [Dermatophilaceae bacterium Soc4.6]
MADVSRLGGRRSSIAATAATVVLPVWAWWRSSSVCGATKARQPPLSVATATSTLSDKG